VSVTGYAYAWDFIDDPDAISRARSLGIDVVAVAASYHATRVVNTFHPARRVTDVPYSAFYGARRDEAWRGHRLTPRAPRWLGRDDAFANAVELLSREGIEVDAWIVLTHFDDPDDSHLEFVERNAYGEPYPYALCPASEDVLQYCVTMVEETLCSASVRGVVLEASGPMGFDHASAHDKTEFAALSVAQRQLLSLCFCAACRKAQRECGLDPDEMASKVRTGIEEDASSPEAALSTELADEFAKYPRTLGTALREAIIESVEVVAPEAKITVHASAGRWATGSFPSLSAEPWRSSMTAVVANAWDRSTAEDELRAMAKVVDGRASLGAYLRLDRDWQADNTDETIQHYVDAGVNELHLYHLGLLTKDSTRTASSVIEGFRPIAPGASERPT